MGYVLVIISFVAMGGPRNTTPTIDHVDFASVESCTSAMAEISTTLKQSHVQHTAKCYVK